MTDKASILKLSQKFLAKGQVDKAIQVWEEFVSSNPDGNIYNMIGDLYLKKNDKKNANAWFHKAAKFIRDEGFSLKALAIYKKILNFDSTDPQALYALGELNEEKGLAPDAIKFYLASIDALNKRGQKSDVLEIYNKILSLAPSNIPLRSKVADNLAKEGLLQDASKELIYIARLYEEKGDSKAAVDYFNKALIIFPRNKDAYLTMSKLYETLGKKKEALDVLSRAFQSFPEDEDLKLQIAHQLITNNEFDQAIDLLKQVGEREPDNIKVKEEIAKIHLLKGNKEKAWTIYSPIVDELLMMKSPDQLIGILREFSEIEPVEVGRKLASLYRQTGEIDNAFHELVKLANILKDSGMYEEATSVINEAGLLKPDNEEVGLLLSSLQQEMGIDQVTAQDNKTTDDLLSEIEVLLRYGQSAAALKMLETLKSREPSHIEVHRKLKVIYLEMGEKELAVTECIILANLYEKNGDAAGREQILNEAYDINPLDPRLPDRGEAPALDE
ncbi:MAG: tetratricopeptide repeat protein, partial [bacterium]